jgi:predicted ester cyclase
MERSEIESLVRRWAVDGVANGRLEVFDELLTEDARDIGGPSPSFGRETFKARASAVRLAFSNLVAAIDALVVEGDRLAWRWSMTGEHVGPFLGVPPTHRRVTIRGVNFQRLEGDRVSEHWTLIDAFGLRDQLAKP